MDRELAVLSAVHQPSPVRIDADVLDRAAKLRELTRQQEWAIRRLADLDGRVVAVAGPGGSGKTYAIGAYAYAAQAAGHHVIGVATTASCPRSTRVACSTGSSPTATEWSPTSQE